MSYSMSINEDYFNYTYNVGAMWYYCNPGKGIREHYGLTGKEAVPILRKLRYKMEDNVDVLVKMNPSNGWGSYHGAKALVNDLIRVSLANPEYTWEGD